MNNSAIYLYVVMIFITNFSISKNIKEVNFSYYKAPNGEMSESYKYLIDSQRDKDLRNLLNKAFEFANQNIRYKYIASSFMSNISKSGEETKFLSCTGFINELFKSASDESNNLVYPYASSKDMVNSRSSGYKTLKQYFEVYGEASKVANIDNSIKGFKPQSGDILAFNYYNPKTKNYRGHAVLVIDPEQCIAINSTSWVLVDKITGQVPGEDEIMTDEVDNDQEVKFDNKSNFIRDKSKSGVYFQKIVNGSCKDGIWSSWDTSRNKFQVLLRHKKLHDEE